MIKPRLIVLTDIFNGFEVDDIQSMVRLLLYSNEIDIEGLIACTSCFLTRTQQKNADIIHSLIDAYSEAKPNLDKHKPDYPSAEYLHSVTSLGIEVFGRRAGKGFAENRYCDNQGVQSIIKAVDKKDDRPLWIGLWGGANTLAQAVWQVSRERSPEELNCFLSKLRIYGISDQDHSSRWLRNNFGDRLFYIVSPSKGSWFGNWQYWRAAWPGISSDNFKHGSEDGSKTRGFSGAEFGLIDEAWLKENIIGKGPLGSLYPLPRYITEGDTPTFLGLISNGLNVPERPDYGGWGGRYKFYLPTKQQCGLKEKYPIWTNSSDSVLGTDKRIHTSPQATVWRWRRAFQNDFAARIRWSVTGSFQKANHNPVITSSERVISAAPGEEVTLRASASDPNGGKCACRWFVYREAGGQTAELTAAADGVSLNAPVRGSVHVIFEAVNDGAPPLTSYARFIVTVKN